MFDKIWLLFWECKYVIEKIGKPSRFIMKQGFILHLYSFKIGVLEQHNFYLPIIWQIKISNMLFILN